MSTTLSTKKPAAAQEPKNELSHAIWNDFGLPSLNRLRQEFDDLWKKFYVEVPALWNAERGDLRWSFDIADEPEAYVVSAEAPGFELSDFHVELRGDQLVLKAAKSKEEKDKDKESFTSSEFYRSMTIPAHVAADKIDAQYKNGVLTVTLPKTKEGKGRKIPVKG
eukprot:TRINITY_DN4605_c1_g1_i1.p2 TRINITY_DN4605_c1_g1~~TRINITY_DN4605_c1_g1_i1.p2  ORF type:complete len:165 (-),score=7.09 TRINITY_DN4605_c1_g1_i1:1767-2261(-)